MKKTAKIGLAYVQFYKTELHRDRKRTKRRLKYPKMKKLQKSQKLKKNQERCANFEIDTHLQNTVASNCEVYISI